MVDFAKLFEASPNPYMVVGPDLRYLAVNAAYEAVAGRPRAELLGRTVFECFPGDPAAGSEQAAIVRASLERVFASGERDVLALVPFSVERDTPAGRQIEERYWSATHTPLFDASGAVHAVLQHTTDVTELQALRSPAAQALSPDQLGGGLLQRARAVQDQNRVLLGHREQLMSMFAQAPGFMAVLRGPEHVYEIANSAYEALLGRQGLIGRSARALLPELVEQGYFDLLDEVLRSGEPFRGRDMAATIAAPGQPPRHLFVDFVFQPLSDPDGRVGGVFIQGADVTERVAAFAALRASEARFRTIADMLPQMIWSTLPDGFHDYYNRRWYEFTGVPDGSTDGEAWNGMFHPDDQDRAWARWRHSLATGEPYEIEYRLRHRSGAYRWTLGRALPVRDAGGAIVRWMGTCTEIHEQKLAQDAVERSERALREMHRRKDQFLATLAHELRNPLAPILTAAQMLRRGGEDPARRQRAAEIIDRQASHMIRLVNDLLDVSRVTRGLTVLQSQPLDLRNALRGALEQVAPLLERKQHRLQVSLPEQPLLIEGDATRLVQVFSNLLTNAGKYTPAGGNLRLDARQAGGEAVVEVCDDGIGIEPELLPQVFDLFTQGDTGLERAEGGLGIGLALVRSLVALHGGRIEAASAGSGQGSVFRVFLPLVGQLAGQAGPG